MGCIESSHITQQSINRVKSLKSIRLVMQQPDSIDKTRTHGPKVEDKIVIVGAGPAGIHMAVQLKKQGYTDVTVLEKSDRIGGKSYTHVDKDGVPHELGTCYLHSDYIEIRDLLREYSIESEDVNVGGRTFRNILPSLETKEGVAPYIVWLLVQTEGGMEIFKDFTEEKFYTTKLWAGIKKYGRLHRSLVGEGYFSLPNRPTDMSKIDKTFHQFLLDNDLAVLIPLMSYIYEGQGYGILTKIPALYGLWWCNPHFIEHAFHWNRDPPTMAMLKHGFENVWKVMAEKEFLNIEYNVDIMSITRHNNGRKVIIEDSQQLRRDFDFLIMAVDMSTQHNLIKDLRKEEKMIFSNMTASTLAATLYESDTHPNTAEIPPEEFWWTRLPQDHKFHGHRNSAKSLRMETKDKSRERKVAYQYSEMGPETIGEILDKTLKEDLETAGEKNVKIIERVNWRYMPRFSQKQINEGYPWKLRGLQGQDRTWYIGSSVCFESVLDVVRYNLGLLNEMAIKQYEEM